LKHAKVHPVRAYTVEEKKKMACPNLVKYGVCNFSQDMKRKCVYMHDVQQQSRECRSLVLAGNLDMTKKKKKVAVAQQQVQQMQNTLKQEKKRIKKLKKVEKKVVSGAMMKVPSKQRVIVENPVGFSRANSVGSPNVDTETKIYSFAVLQPFEAYARGLHPGIPDNSIAPTFKFSSRMVMTINPVANGGTFSTRVLLSSFGNGSFMQATTYTAGVPSAYTSTNDPGYSSWSTNLELVRCVAMGMRLRNTTALTSASGLGTMVQAEFANVQLTSSAALAQMATASNFSLASTSSVGQIVRVPVSGSVVQDLEYWVYNSTAGNNSQILVFDITGAASTASSYEVEVIKHYEARPLAASATLLPSNISGGNPAEAARILGTAIGADPISSSSRSVKCEGDEDGSLIKDVNTIWGGAQALLRVGATVGKALGSFGKWLFGHEKLVRHMSVFDEKDWELFNSYVVRSKHVKEAFQKLNSDFLSQQRREKIASLPIYDDLIEEIASKAGPWVRLEEDEKRGVR
jgi:hypothetical protein